MKLVTVVGARPQFIKAAMLSRAIRVHNSLLTTHHSPLTTHDSRLPADGVVAGVTEVLVHTGQHYDHEMDKVFFEQLDMPEPAHHLGVGSGSHGDQTGRMLSTIERVLLKEKPDAVLVYGDTNSTIAGALASAKLGIPVGHIEAGMRSFDRNMPEEINRVVTGHLAKWHFCPTETAVSNLRREGVIEGVHLTGDVMQDAVMFYKDKAQQSSVILQKLGLSTPNSRVTSHQSPVTNHDSPVTSHQSPVRKYALATVHRAENTDNCDRLQNILEALVDISKEMSVVFPVHPRTKKSIEDKGLMSLITSHKSLITTNPLPYLDLLRLEGSASVIITDSGGIQKEAFWLGVPCVTMRDETEWVETVETGWNKIAGANKGNIASAAYSFVEELAERKNTITNDVSASSRIVDALIREMN